MKIDETTVRHVAGLAELAIADDDVPVLAHQLANIVAMVEQLQELPLDDADPLVVGPPQMAMREDVIAPIAMAISPPDLAPAFDEGFFIVPRLGGMAAE